MDTQIPKIAIINKPVCGMHKEHHPASFALDVGFLMCNFREKQDNKKQGAKIWQQLSDWHVMVQKNALIIM